MGKSPKRHTQSHPAEQSSRDALRVEQIPIERVTPYPNNPRRNAAAVDAVARSLKTFGWRQPIVVDEGLTVIAGHTRLAAAQALGMEMVPVHIALGLTVDQVRAYRLADNRTGEDAEWDDERLALELQALDQDEFDLSLTGFSELELSEILAFTGGILEGVDVDDAPALPVEAITRPGDVIQLGCHRLACGDATKPADLERLMDGAVAELLWTDPPYGVNYVGGTKDKLTIANDDSEGLSELLRGAFASSDAVMAPSARIYCASPGGPRGIDFRLAFVGAGWKFHQSLVWAKNAMVLGHSDYHHKHEDILFGGKTHEDILYGWKPGEGRPGRGRHKGTRWYGDNRQTTVLEYDKPARSSEHPTMKPVELIAQCLRNSSQHDDVILDSFSGSGSTLIACEQERRSCYALELDPKYCDVIVTRWEQATGLTAVRS